MTFLTVFVSQSTFRIDQGSPRLISPIA